MLISADDCVLLLIDLQSKLLPAIHDADAVLAQCLRLARIAALLGVPVLGTQQYPARLGGNVDAIQELCRHTLSKQHFDACADGLPELLPVGRKSVILTGCEAHVCVLQTAFGLLERGYRVCVAADAVGARAPANRDAALARLRQTGAEIVSVEMVAFEWLRDSQHPRFREALAILK
ncbi:nicotinamidase-related amidase [Oxalobacteraceae bacterium GrIS 1.11]